MFEDIKMLLRQPGLEGSREKETTLRQVQYLVVCFTSWRLLIGKWHKTKGLKHRAEIKV